MERRRDRRRRRGRLVIGFGDALSHRDAGYEQQEKSGTYASQCGSFPWLTSIQAHLSAWHWTCGIRSRVRLMYNPPFGDSTRKASVVLGFAPW
jgi:hypothetical protein